MSDAPPLDQDPAESHGDHVDDLSVLYDTLDSLGSTLESVLDRVEALEQGASESPAAAGDDEESAGDASSLPPVVPEVSGTLGAWVAWLVGRYGLAAKFPKNWQEVPGVVDELAALHAAWICYFSAATGEPFPGFEPTQWHDALQRVLGRIKDVWLPEHRAARQSEGATSPIRS